MPCPLYSKREQECLLLAQVAAEDEEDAMAEVERMRADHCLGGGDEFRACPIFRRLTVESTKAY